MTIKEPKNPNYCATVVAIGELRPLANCDRIQAAIIFGQQVIVGIDVSVGDVGLFFPAETKLSEEFLFNNNLYRHAEKNRDPLKVGYFEDHGRIKTVRYRGHRSEGFWAPISFISYTGLVWPSVVKILPIGTAFDAIGDQEICSKYTARRNPGKTGFSKQQKKQIRLEDSLVEGQFAFHYKTTHLDKDIDMIRPTDRILISDKWHGTSAVIGKLPAYPEPRWWQRLLGIKPTPVPTLTWASRNVIKGVGKPKPVNFHYYGNDVWGEVAYEIGHLIPAGFTLYGEIVGFTSSGREIQKDYHYGCDSQRHRFLVYRVTATNQEGLVIELDWPQVVEFCGSRGIETVRPLFYGQAIDFCQPQEGKSWHESFLEKVKSEFIQDQDCPYNPGLPAEGVVVRVERLQRSRAFKIKNFRFKERESKLIDKGVPDMEEDQSEEEASYVDGNQE